MGTNVIYLADLATRHAAPSVQRPRPAASRVRRAAATSDTATPAAACAVTGDLFGPADEGAPTGSWADRARRRVAERVSGASADAANAGSAAAPRPGVRVVRLRDAGDPAPGGMGRLRISGRLVDVCAELERLASAEARAAAQARRA